MHTGLDEVLALERPPTKDVKLPWYMSWKKIYE